MLLSLPVYPLKYHTEKDDVRENLIAQGKLWEEHKWYHYRQYGGTASGASEGGHKSRYHVKSSIIIDAEAFGIFSSYGPVQVHGHMGMPQELTDDQRMTISDKVYGYSLTGKERLEFTLRGVSEIEWNNHAFEPLDLPQ